MLENSHELEQAKRRDRKVYITDIAIDKVPLVQYDGFTDEQNRIMYELANRGGIKSGDCTLFEAG